MAKFYSRSHVVVLTYKEGNGYPVDQTEYSVRSLGRGRWLVEREDGFRWGARTSELEQLFRPRVYEDGYHSSGEPEVAYEEVRVDRDTWWRW